MKKMLLLFFIAFMSCCSDSDIKDTIDIQITLPCGKIDTLFKQDVCIEWLVLESGDLKDLVRPFSKRVLASNIVKFKIIKIYQLK